jgi:hypothetical protein
MLKICIYNFQEHKMRKTPERFKALSGVYEYVSLVQLHEKALALHGLPYFNIKQRPEWASLYDGDDVGYSG